MNEFIDLLLPWWWGETDRITDSFISAILLSFIILSIILIRKTFRRASRIDSLSEEVGKYNRPAEPSIMHSLKVGFERNNLAEAWQDFEDSLITREVNENREVVYKTDDSSLFFGEDRLLDQHLNLRFWNSVPALLVGLGILGTFVGLVWGLRPFAGIDFTEIEKIGDAIKTLLSGVSTAFVTSVWGMSFSLVFNLFEKRRMGRMSQAITNLQRALDKLFTLTTQEAISFRQEDELAQQTAALKSFSTDLANEIKGAMAQGRQEIIHELQKAPQDFSNAMAEKLVPSLSILNTTVEKLREQKEESSINAIEQLVETFHESLSGATSAHLEGLAKVVRSAGESLTTLPGHLISMKEQIDQSRKLLEDTSQDQTRQMKGTMDEMLEAFQNAIDTHQSRLSATTNSANEEITRIATDIRDLLTSAANQADEQLERRIADMEAVSAKSIQTLETAIAELQQSLTSNLEAQQQTIRNIAAQTETASVASIDRIRQLVELSAERLEEVIQAGEQSISTLLNQQSKQISAIDAQLANTEKTLVKGRDMLEQMDASAGSVKQMIETTEALSSQLMRGAERVEAAGRQLTQASSVFNQENESYLAANRETIEQLQGTLVQSRELLSDFAQRFQTIDSGLQGIFAEIQRGMTEYTTISRDSINEYLRAFSTQLTSAANALAGSVEALGDNVEVLNDMIERIRQR